MIFRLKERALLNALGDNNTYTASCDKDILSEWPLSEDVIYATLLPFNTQTRLIIPPINTIDKSTHEQKGVVEATTKAILEKIAPHISTNMETNELFIPVRSGVGAGH